jgi:hypothetical protein
MTTRCPCCSHPPPPALRYPEYRSAAPTQRLRVSTASQTSPSDAAEPGSPRAQPKPPGRSPATGSASLRRARTTCKGPAVAAPRWTALNGPRPFEGRVHSVGVRRPSHGGERKRACCGCPDGPTGSPRAHTGDSRKRTKEGTGQENRPGRVPCRRGRVPVQAWASPGADVGESRCRCG